MPTNGDNKEVFKVIWLPEVHYNQGYTRRYYKSIGSVAT